jgi:hypothetical protein
LQQHAASADLNCVPTVERIQRTQHVPISSASFTAAAVCVSVHPAAAPAPAENARQTSWGASRASSGLGHPCSNCY